MAPACLRSALVARAHLVFTAFLARLIRCALVMLVPGLFYAILKPRIKYLTVIIPRSAAGRRELMYARLLWRVHPDRTLANAFEGKLLKPGARIELSDLWPHEGYPRTPVLLECAGSDHSGRGHNRSKQIYVLWRFEAKRGWVELARTLTEGAEWIVHLMPLALRELGGPARLDPDLAANVATTFLGRLDDELKELGAGDRALALSFVYEQLAARMMRAEA